MSTKFKIGQEIHALAKDGRRRICWICGIREEDGQIIIQSWYSGQGTEWEERIDDLLEANGITVLSEQLMEGPEDKFIIVDETPDPVYEEEFRQYF